VVNKEVLSENKLLRQKSKEDKVESTRLLFIVNTALSANDNFTVFKPLLSKL